MILEPTTASSFNPAGIPSAWLALGFFGQGLFASRFVVQWVASERRRASVVPRVFWSLSIAGGLCLLAYALLRRDAVIVAGQLGGLAIYARNVALLRGADARHEPAAK